MVLKHFLPAPMLVALAGILLLAPPAPASPLLQPACPPLPDPAQFVAKIDNPYLTLKPGKTFIYKETLKGKTLSNKVEVTRDTKLILGVNTTVVHDTVRDKKGDLIEDTFDWYAQDTTGNVWYFGEDTTEYKNGKAVSTAGSWEGGVNGDPGIIMEADPQVGDSYGQECAPGVAEDGARVIDLGASVTVPYGSFKHVVVTEEFSLLEPDVLDHKYYASGVGLVREERVQGGSEELVLVDVT